MKISRYKPGDECSYALGASLTVELLKSRQESVRQVFYSTDAEHNEKLDYITSLCSDAGIVPETNDKPFNVLSQKGNCYVIAVFEKFKPKTDNGNHILLVNPSDAGNLGTIIRTAAGFGLLNICIIPPAADIFDPKTVRASMGALFHVNYEYFDSFESYRERFSENNLFSFMLTSSTPLESVPIKSPFTLVFGNEASGLPDSYAETCTSVRIPHSDRIDSLSLPIAAGIGIYTATKNLQ